MVNRILRLPDVKEKCSISRSSIYQGMADGTFPQSIPLGTRMVGWSQSEIDEWIESKLNARSEQRVQQ